MKKYLFIVILLITAVCLLACSCSEQRPTYRKAYPKTQVTAMTDERTEGTIVSSARSYTRVALENPGSYLMEYGDVYFDREHLTFYTSSYSGAVAALVYDNNGTLTAERRYSDTYPQFYAAHSYLLSDGTVLHYGTRDPNGSLTSVIRCDADLNELDEVTLSTYEGASFTSLADIHVQEYADGTYRILISEVDYLYYLDENLNILFQTELVTEYDGIYRESEGVYILGNTMPQMCRADMNTGEVTRIEELPVPKSWTYRCDKYQYGADGLLYCEYDGSVYQCDGTGNVREILCWDDGMFDGRGTYWILDENTVYFLPQLGNAAKEMKQLCLLKIADEERILDRHVLTLANLSEKNNAWFRAVIDLFNTQNEEYYIEVLDFRYRGRNEPSPEEQLNQYLLETGIPDMVIFGKNTESTDYIDKALLLDLSPHFGDRLLGCARSAYMTATGEQYLLPLSMQAKLFASAVLDENLTWDILQAMTDGLSNDTTGQEAVASYDISDDLMTLSLFDFYDTETKTASFDTDAFRDRIRLLDALKTRGIVDAYGYFGKGYSTNFRYGITGSGAIVNAVRTGDVRLLYVPFHSLGAYPALKRIFEATPFTLCGYPTVDGDDPCVSVHSQNLLGVFADSGYLGGCSAFLAFLLSDEVQGAAALTQTALPVTHSGFAAALEDYRYTYYSTMGAKNDLEPYDHSAVQMPDYLTFGYYSESILSDGDLADILSFFDSCTSRAAPDAAIAQIVTEELSAYESGAKTLEEVTRLMQSRVSIYLNE